MELEPIKVETSKWKKDLNTQGYILCPRETCQMGFLSVKGMEVHCTKCVGTPNEGDFVCCPICRVRFKTFLIMERHKAKNHSHPNGVPYNPNIRNNSLSITPHTFSSGSQSLNSTGPLLPTTPGLVNDLFSDAGEDRVETSEQLRARILAESRKISTSRPPGRPPKHKPPMMKFDMQRPPSIQRRIVNSPNSEITIVNRFEDSGKMQPPKMEDLALKEEELNDKERQLAMREARLREYQERVLRYERLAEDATRVALQEKEMRLRKFAEELRDREIQAKRKLANAVQSLEILKDEGASNAEPSVVSTPPAATSSPMPRRPSTSGMGVPDISKIATIIKPPKEMSIEVSDAITTDDDEDELPASISEVSAPTRDIRNLIMQPPPDKSPETVQDQSLNDEPEDLSNNAQAVQAPPVGTVTVASTADPNNGVIVVNHESTLETLLSRAQRGEVTLLAQAKEDGTYVLIENTMTSTVQDHSKQAQDMDQAREQIILSDKPMDNDSNEDIAEARSPPEAIEDKNEVIMADNCDIARGSHAVENSDLVTADFVTKESPRKAIISSNDNEHKVQEVNEDNVNDEAILPPPESVSPAPKRRRRLSKEQAKPDLESIKENVVQRVTRGRKPSGKNVKLPEPEVDGQKSLTETLESLKKPGKKPHATLKYVDEPIDEILDEPIVESTKVVQDAKEESDKQVDDENEAPKKGRQRRRSKVELLVQNFESIVTGEIDKKTT